MKGTRSIVCSFLILALTFGILVAACGPQNSILEACKAQENEADCLSIGNNILMLSDESAAYECAWVNKECVSKLKQSK